MSADPLFISYYYHTWNYLDFVTFTCSLRFRYVSLLNPADSILVSYIGFPECQLRKLGYGGIAIQCDKVKYVEMTKQH